ncbi:hypothetical protein, partial [Vibrio jasicida]|uniref:hypothetical protein n=1 Tax=Vibrio jasicida TaxID=766224 RepID=UPI0005EDFFD0
GEHIVSYIVGDNYGGYSSGLIKVNVTVPSKAPTWTGLTTKAGQSFTAPLTYAQATELGFAVSAINDTEVDNVVAQYNAAAATSYCATKGHLPTVSEFLALREEHWKTDGVGMKKWPQGGVGQDGNYLVRGSGDTYKVVDVKTGEASEATSRTQAYVTCVENNAFSLTMLKTECIANGEPCEVVQVTKPSASDVISREMPKVSGTLVEADVDTVISPTSTRHQVVTASSTKTGTYQFGVELEGKWDRLATGIINFTRDWTQVTAELSTESHDETVFLANGVTASLLGVRFVDVNGPVAAERIRASSEDDSVIIIKPEVGTDTGGRARFVLKTAGLGARTISFSPAGHEGQSIHDTVSISPTVRTYKGETTDTGYNWTFETTTNPGSVDNIGSTVFIPPGTVFKQASTISSSYSRFSRVHIGVMPGGTLLFRRMGQSEGWTAEEARARCHADLNGHRIDPDADANFVWIPSRGGSLGFCATGYRVIINPATDVNLCDPATESGAHIVCDTIAGNESVLTMTKVVEPTATFQEGRDWSLGDFERECGGDRPVGPFFSPRISSAQCPYWRIDTSWDHAKPVIGVSGPKLRNNLGMELGDLP